MSIKYGEQSAYFYGILYGLIGGFLIFYSENIAKMIADIIVNPNCSLGQGIVSLVGGQVAACHILEFKFLVFIAGAIMVASALARLITILKKE
jgi:glycerol uptake facilitator-like aquaporin